MVDNFYDSIEEARFRLENTIVEYDGRPVFVSSVADHPDGVFRVMIHDMPFPGGMAGRGARKVINSPLFRRFQTIPLGWCNHFEENTRHASFVERAPVRRSKQGLAGDAFIASSFNGTGFARSPFTWERAKSSDGFVEMVTNVYPSFEEALSQLIENTSIAFDRKFVLIRSGRTGLTSLAYKKELVGIFIKGTVYLFDKYRYLYEEISGSKAIPCEVEVGV